MGACAYYEKFHRGWHANAFLKLRLKSVVSALSAGAIDWFDEVAGPHIAFADIRFSRCVPEAP